MLTIHTPIELTVDPSILQLNDNFTERLTGNYKMIGSGLEPEDMLHFMSEPPEVYLEEGGMTALIDNKTVFENRTLKMDVINNVLNRILVSDTYRMTYQDKVFIESVLSRVGVTDVKTFISQVQNIRQEMKNVSRLTDLYWSESEILSQLLEYRQERAKDAAAQETDEEKREEENILWLHQNIMNRLQTGAVYQELKNYLSATISNHKYITDAEMQISEQTVTAQNILLNKLKNYTTTEEQPLVYHYLNTYEMGDETQVNESHAQTVNQMVQAVLLNALHQMYALRTEELLSQNHVWYELAGAVYQATENTFRRFEAYHERNYISLRDADTYTKTVQEYQTNEIRAMEQFFTDNRRILAVTRTEDRVPESEMTYAAQDGGDDEAQNGIVSGLPGQVIQNTEKTEIHGQQIQSITRQEMLLKQQLEQINQNNIKNSQLLRQMVEGHTESREAGRINREAARKDALRALTEPKEVLLDYLERETREEQREELVQEHLTKVFGEETVRIFETLEKYQKTPELMTASGQVMPDAADMLIRDIQFENSRSETELIHNIQELSEESVYETQSRQVLREYLPEQVKQIHRETQKNIERVELLHRQEETSLEEEMLEEIRGLHRSNRIENRQITEETVESSTTQQVINNKINEIQTRQNEEIARMINEKVQRQLGDISEQVYGKLEKRMDTERRRRGL